MASRIKAVERASLKSGHLFFLMMLALGQLAGCVTTGSKSALGIGAETGWQLDHDEYEYRDGQVIISIPEIVVGRHLSAIGAVLPVIPRDHDSNYAAEQLDLSITITGFPSGNDPDPEEIVVEAVSVDPPLKVLSQSVSLVAQSRTNNKEGKLWVQFSARVRDDARLGELDTLTLRFTLPMFSEPVPDLVLVRKTTSDTRVVLTPGT